MSDPLLPEGSNRCKCTSCNEYFSSPSAFVAHQKDAGGGRVRCVPPPAAGLQRKAVKGGEVWAWPGMDDATKAKASGVWGIEQ